MVNVPRSFCRADPGPKQVLIPLGNLPSPSCVHATFCSQYRRTPALRYTAVDGVHPRNRQPGRKWDKDWIDCVVNKTANVERLSWKCRRHVATCRHDMTFHSNFGQMGPCRRHDIEDVVAVCVGLSRHLPDFSKCNMYGVMIITLIALSSHPLLVLSLCRPLVV